MVQLWFTSDFHFDHKNIIRFNNRPFDPNDVSNMNDRIITFFNERVDKRDIVYYLGDFAWTKNPKRLWHFANQLNGLWTFVMGNHDYAFNLKPFFHEFGECVVDLVTIKWKKEKITLCHYPLRSWPASHHGSWHLHGHMHLKQQENNGKVMDVGVDANNFRPVSFDEVKAYMDKQLCPEEYHTSLV